MRRLYTKRGAVLARRGDLGDSREPWPRGGREHEGVRGRWIFES